VATLLVDSPPVSSEGQATPNGSAPAPTEPAQGAASQAGGGRCANCSAPLAAGQEWCLQCGLGAPGSLGSPDWRVPATVLAAVLVLVLGAAAAAYAALNKSKPKPHVIVATVTPTPTPVTPVPTTPATPLKTPLIAGATATPKVSLPLGKIKPPKIPLTAAVPSTSEKSHKSGSSSGGTNSKSSTPSSSTGSKSTGSATEGSKEGSGASGEENQQAAILLDTNAASTYNPYNYPASEFGDPSLAIDGDTSTAWTAQVNPATAPSMAEGLLIDLKRKQKVSAVQLISSTPGMTVQVYGTSEATAPSSITDPAWTPLTGSHVAKKKHLRLALRDSGKAFSFITLWISRAPEASVGTPEAPGHVDVNELELFPTQ